MTKICKTCNKELPLEEFTLYNDAYRRIHCRKCVWLLTKEKRKKNPDLNLLEKANKYKANIRLKHKIKIIEYFGSKCAICGLIDEPCVYDVHHLNPEEKDKNLSSLSLHKWENIENELAKCQLLCSNCHRKLHTNNRATLKKKGYNYLLK